MQQQLQNNLESVFSTSKNPATPTSDDQKAYPPQQSPPTQQSPLTQQEIKLEVPEQQEPQQLNHTEKDTISQLDTVATKPKG